MRKLDKEKIAALGYRELRDGYREYLELESDLCPSTVQASSYGALFLFRYDPALFWELFWYLVSGVCSTAVSFVGYSLCFRKWGLGNVWSKILSWTAAATTAFVLMRLLAFPGTETGWLESAWAFYVTRVATAALTVLLMWAVIDRALRWDLRDKARVKTEYGWWPEAINLIVTLLEIALNYFVAKFLVF